MEPQKSRGTGTSAQKRVGSRRSWQGVALGLRSKEGGGGGGGGGRTFSEESVSSPGPAPGGLDWREASSQLAGGAVALGFE